MRNVTYHLQNRVQYFKDLRQFLKPDSRIIIIEYKKGNSHTFHDMFGHAVKNEILIEEIEAAGYILQKEYNFLSDQHFTIYT